MKMEETENIDISKIAGGAVAESIKFGLDEVFENILDPNTDPEKVRKLTLVFEFKPDESRQVIKTKTSCKTTLCPTNAITTQMLIGRSGDKIVAEELLKHDPNQIGIEDLENEGSNNVININKEAR